MKRASTTLAIATAALGFAQAGTVTFNYGAEVPISASGPTTPQTPFLQIHAGAPITDMNVRLEGLTHDSWRQLDAMLLLLSEDGQAWERGVVLRSGNTFDIDDIAVDGIEVTFDDEADFGVPVNNLVTGSYKPTDDYDYITNEYLPWLPKVRTLAEFADGLVGTRTVALFVYDYFPDELGGSIGDWAVDIEVAAEPVPLPGVGLGVGAFAAAAFLRKRRS
ncbi:hypothetical protein HK107_11055 [Parvularcula sp. ZS-1/3]|uniref:PEP-CTERM sorting domain-containing protein n=1 Tax=Parvularcula mediterranea TaxID=2732508 RepID=A0A7Y3RNK4_9PROT|nr:hypothetical protein [Parvularcula mediterranea]NNU16856.1 hypothetical protein [Parvularcula mediterranea]